MKIFSPGDAKKEKAKPKTNIPQVVFDVINELIAADLNNGIAIVYQHEVVDELVKRGVNRNQIFNKGWLDVENNYRVNGWQVEFYKGAYYEDERIDHFTFTEILSNPHDSTMMNVS